MPETAIPVLLYTYAAFLICCGIASVIFIGMKAKTALMSGGMAASMSALVGYLISTETAHARFAGILVTLALFCVFAWRSTKTLFTLFSMIPEKSPELKGKGIAFLVIGLMATVSVFVTILQIVSFLDC